MSPIEIAGTIRLAVTALYDLGAEGHRPRLAADAIEFGPPAAFGFDGPHEVLNTVRDLVASLEESDRDEGEVQALRAAYAEACTLYRHELPGDGEDNRHEPLP